MIPILAETVWSIIHGPATTGHIVEVSQFLKRPIDVWAEDRLMLFGRCHNRHKPRLHLKYKSLTNKCASCKSSSSSKAMGHFTLLKGQEPRNPDARSHPENCGFDVISDQTGYPATALRQVAVQRMLAKLYESRLRGRDHHFQCSRCGISGGEDWSRENVKRFIKNSRYIHKGHAHVHVRRENCERGCACDKKYAKHNDLAVIDCMQKYLIIYPWEYQNIITLFASDQDLEDCLVKALEEVENLAACICGRNNNWCNNIFIPKDHAERKGVIIKNVLALEKNGYEYDLKTSETLVDKPFRIHSVKVIMACHITNGGFAIAANKNLYLLTMYPRPSFRKEQEILYQQSVSSSNHTQLRDSYTFGAVIEAAFNKLKK